MAKVWVCTNPDHPTSKHPKKYDRNTQDGFCPDCDFGEGILVEMEEEQEDEVQQPGRELSMPVIDQVGLCILVCDASISMTEPAFPNSSTTKIDMVVRSAANGIVDRYNIRLPEKAYIALIGFGGKAAVLEDTHGKPFIKPIARIKEEFPTVQELAKFIRSRIAPDNNDPLTDTIDRESTDISKALSLAHSVYQAALQGDLSKFGVHGRINLMEHNPYRLSDGKQFTVPNVRILIYSDGQHLPADGTPLASPFRGDLEAGQVSVLMTAFFGDGSMPGADEMKKLACVCPVHEVKGYFLIDRVERYHSLREIFHMATGTSGFCPRCRIDQKKELQGISAG